MFLKNINASAILCPKRPNPTARRPDGQAAMTIQQAWRSRPHRLALLRLINSEVADEAKVRGKSPVEKKKSMPKRQCEVSISVFLIFILFSFLLLFRVQV